MDHVNHVNDPNDEYHVFHYRVPWRSFYYDVVFEKSKQVSLLKILITLDFKIMDLQIRFILNEKVIMVRVYLP